MKEVLIYREDLKILLNEENNNWSLSKIESDDKKEITPPQLYSGPPEKTEHDIKLLKEYLSR